MRPDGRPAAGPAATRCRVCGTPAEAGARYCIHCGQAFDDAPGLRCPACTANNLPGEPFCEACGTPLPVTPYLVITDTGLRWPLFGSEQTSVVVGRSDPLTGVFPEVDLQPFGADRAGVSRHHARITRRNEACWLEDLHSVNYTYLNDQRLLPDRPARLKDGDLLRLGQLLITFRAG